MAVMSRTEGHWKGRQDTKGLGRGSVVARLMVLPILCHGDNMDFGAVSMARNGCVRGCPIRGAGDGNASVGRVLWARQPVLAGRFDTRSG